MIFSEIDSKNTDKILFNKSSICAVVITYQPELVALFENMQSCRLQVDHLILVDNGSDKKTQENIVRFSEKIGCEVLLLIENLGVAAAQNLGIAKARAAMCGFVLLLDQDSSPRPGMVRALSRTLVEMSSQGIPVAAVGPRLVDRRTGESMPFVCIGLLGVTRHVYKPGNALSIATDFLISSGMMIPLSMLDKVGLPEEGLFIDNVDLEWCFRARSMGYRLFGVGDAVMEHAVGDRVTKLGRRVIYRHSPLRQYYMMRNRIVLYQRSYSPWGWVVQDFIRLLFKFTVFSLFFSPRRQNIHMMSMGIKDGIRNKLGKFR